MRPRRGFSNTATRGSTKYANKIANRKSVRVSRAAYRNANAKAKMSVVHRIRRVFGSQTLLSMLHLRPLTHRGGKGGSGRFVARKICGRRFVARREWDFA